MIWFLFFFAVFAGLALLFIAGTHAGTSQKVRTEDACDPYAPPPVKVKKTNKVPVKPKRSPWEDFGDAALARGEIVEAMRFYDLR